MAALCLLLRGGFPSLQWMSLVPAHRLSALGLQQLPVLAHVATASVVVAHGLSCSTACGIFPDQGSNLCPLHWQADFKPLDHQGSPCFTSLGDSGFLCHHLSYGYKKSKRFFSLFSFLLVVMTEGRLPSSLNAESKVNLRILSKTESKSVWRRKKERRLLGGGDL